MSYPLFQEYEPHTVNVDSSDYASRDSPLVTVVPGLSDCAAFYIESLQIPFSYFVVDFTNNVLVVYIGAQTDGSPQNGAVRYTIYLEPGTFTASTFPISFSRVVATSYSSATPWLGGVNKSTYSGGAWGAESGSAELSTTYGFTAFPYAGDSKITWYMAITGSAVPFWIDCTNVTGAQSPDDPSQMLGLSTSSILYSGASTSSIVVSNSGTSTVTTYWCESPYCYNFAGPSKIYIRSQTISSMQPNGTETTAVRTVSGVAGTSQNIIGAIDVNQNYGGVISYHNTFPQPIPLSMTNSFSNFDLYFTLGTRTQFNDGVTTPVVYTNHLQFQGQSFQIRIKFLCKKKSTNEMSSNNRGDRLYRSLPLLTGGNAPQDQVYGPGSVMRGSIHPPSQPQPRRQTQQERDRSNSYPITRPSMKRRAA